MSATRRRRTGELDRLVDVVAPDDIRIKGHRIGIEDVLLLHLDGYVPERIAARYPTLTLREIRATIAYYEGNREHVDAYLRAVLAHDEAARRAQQADPSPARVRLRALASARPGDARRDGAAAGRA